ncbi:Protein EFR3 [Wickerhamiella sorbophila]|uniref:Protein EFR3 n=1 Tax=Wickerhamiella sorbophila TaxID=45607 RepID=A0A2T0FGY3_9ASCO|nr:Protein EFR3 [Wickerhamiella sorbophila]PRT54227.1 Protein EFR3 [Wickerhamiella sorbophila]
MRHLKYERLIRACYPPGLGDKKPKPSELSYLIYYLNTHRSQIPQASEFLERKALKYVAKNRIGNASVTVGIMSQMIQDCKDDLNNFAPEAISIIAIALDSSELGLLNCASEAFRAFNINHDGLQFAYDKQLVEDYRALVRKFIVISTSAGPQSRIQHGLGLQALSSLSISAALSTTVGQETLEEAVPTFYSTLPVDETGAVFERFNLEFASIEAHSIIDMAKNTHNLALWALRRSFDTSNGSLVVRLTSRLLTCMERLDTRPTRWLCALFEAAAQWAQVQLRYKVVQTLIERMCRLDIAAVDAIKSYSVLLQSLLGSATVSFVGLAVTDVLRDLLKLQHRLVTSEFGDAKLKQNASELVIEIRKIIGSLGQHTVYAGQVTDMVAEILWKYSSTGAPPERAQSGASVDHKNPQVISTDMLNVRELIDTLPATERLMVNLWASTQWLLNSEDVDVLKNYTLAFVEYLRRAHRVVKAQARIESSIGRQLANVLLDSHNKVVNYIAIYYCLTALAEHLGEHAISICRWAYHVQEVGVSNSKMSNNESVQFSSLQVVSLLSVSQGVLLAIFTAARRQEPADTCLQVIKKRVSEQLWLPGIIYPATIPITDALSVALNQPPSEPSSMHAENDTSVIITIEQLQLSEEERSWVSASDEGIDDLTFPEAFNIYKKRAPSVAASAHTDLQFSSVRSNHTSETDTPTVSQLIRRASSSISMQNSGRASRPTTKPTQSNSLGLRAQVADILADLKLDSSSRGKLAV